MLIVIFAAIFIFIAIIGYSCCAIAGEADDMANEYSKKKAEEMDKKEYYSSQNKQ